MELNSSFEQFLSLYWLRPETALWRELDIRAMKDFEMLEPSLDLGCGDGLFSFVRAGGRLSKRADVFSQVGDLGKFYENVDVYDNYKTGEKVEVIKSPAYSIDIGFDHKINLLKKSDRLGFYNKMVAGDANSSFPYAANSFRSIFSNILYWLENPIFVLREIERVLMPGGIVCLMLPNRSFPEFSFYNKLYASQGDEKWKFLEMIDRGRFKSNIQQFNSASGWEELFGKVGLSVIDHKTHLSKTVIEIWDIGLRPLFPVLKKMTDHLDSESYLEIKAEWMDIVGKLILPIIDMDDELCPNEEKAFHCYFLQKNKNYQ